MDYTPLEANWTVWLPLYHLVLVVVHGATAIAQYVIPTKFSTPTGMLRLAMASGGTDASLQLEHATQVDTGNLSVIFLAMAAVDHAAILLSWKLYTKTLRPGQCVWWRWFEYSFSASLMNVEIALLCGVVDTLLLVSIAVSTAVVMVCGAFAEMSDDKDKLRWHITGWLAFLAAWFPIIWTFAAFGSGAPEFVHAVFYLLFVCELSFGVLALATMRSGMEQKREFGYATLSLVAKQLLAWIVFGGVIARDPVYITKCGI